MRFLAARAWVEGLIHAVELEQHPRSGLTFADPAARSARRRGAKDREVRFEIRDGRIGNEARSASSPAQRHEVRVYIFVRYPTLKGKLGSGVADALFVGDAARLTDALHKSTNIGEGDEAQAVTVTATDWAAVGDPDQVPAVRIAARIRYEEAR